MNINTANRSKIRDIYLQKRWERFPLSLEERAGVRTVVSLTVPQTVMNAF